MGCLGFDGTGAVYEFAANEFTGAGTVLPDALGVRVKGWLLVGVVHLDDDLIGWTGLLISALAGGGGAVVLLAAFWRPDRSG